MLELIEDGERSSIEAGTLRLVFRREGERWVHWIEHREGDASAPRVLAITLEGDPLRDDPARVVSPAYQQLQFQAVGPIQQALLVGQSGPHHFSAVFSVEARERGGASIAVDVADRCRGPVEALASTYTVDARSDELIEADSTLAAWAFGPHRLTFSASLPAQVCLAEAGRRATQVQALAGLEAGSPTRRFLYRWQWDPERI